MDLCVDASDNELEEEVCFDVEGELDLPITVGCGNSASWTCRLRVGAQVEAAPEASKAPERGGCHSSAVII